LISYLRNIDKAEVISRLTEYLEAKDEVLSAYIFGSFVSSDLFHDIDIAVFVKENYGYKNLNRYPYGYESCMLAELSRVLKTDKIDFVVLNSASLLLTMRIINSGMRLFDKNVFERVAFEDQRRKEYIDTEPLRRIQAYYVSRERN
jgi:predicted nucleotidyltransferase